MRCHLYVCKIQSYLYCLYRAAVPEVLPKKKAGIQSYVQAAVFRSTADSPDDATSSAPLAPMILLACRI